MQGVYQMSGEVIKSFLVGLGFDVDDSSLSKFNKSISSATLKVTAMATAIEASASAITYAIAGVSEDFEKLGYQYRLITPAINKAIILRRELFNAYSRAGINLQDVVVKSVKFNMSLTKTRFALEALYKSVASRFFTLLTKQSDLFRQKIYENMPKIQKILESLVGFIFKALEAVTQLGIRLWSILGRVYDFFVQLDEKTDGWSTKILAFIALWELLNLDFLLTPLGRIIALFGVLLSLYDDFETYQEGGESALDWSKYIPTIERYTMAVQNVWQIVKNLYGDLVAVGRIIGNVTAAVTLAATGHGSAALDALGDIGNIIKDPLGTNLQTTPNGIPYANPLAHMSQNSSQTNVNAQQQTTNNFYGTANADAVGKTIGEENRTHRVRVENTIGSMKSGGVTPPAIP